MIELKTLNKKQLLAFIQSDSFEEMPVLPISKLRAWSHIHNPRAEEDDVLLIIAYENDILLGYLGVLPDHIYDNNFHKCHVGWLSCIWVSPHARGKGIAKKMVMVAYEKYNYHVLITNFTKEAALLYQKLGIFQDLKELIGVRYYRKMCLAEVLPNRFPKIAFLKGLFIVVDTIFNLFWSPFIKKNNIEIDMKEEVPSNDFLRNSNIFNIQAGFKRTQAEFEWIEHFPWINKVKVKSNEAKKYHFSSEEKQFESAFVKITKDNKVIGYLKYTIRNKHLKIPYLVYTSSETKEFSQAINKLVHEKDISYITLILPSQLMNELEFKHLYKKTISRRFKITKELFQKIKSTESFTIFDGDGDAVFT